MKDFGPEKFKGEPIEVEDESELHSTDSLNPSGYVPGDIIEFEDSEDIPEWLEYQVVKTRNIADEVNDAIDIYNRFLDEDWDSIPSEVDGFLREHGFEGEEDSLNYLANLGAEKAVKLEEQRNLVNDIYNGTGNGVTGLRIELEQETREKINAELTYASQTLTEVERSGATTEGGHTPPKPLGNPTEKSLGFQYRELLEEDSEEVDWLFDRRAYRN